MLYVVAKGGTPKAAADKGANDAIGLIAVLGTTPPKKVTVNEFTTVASAVTCAQFLKGETLSGKPLGLRIAAGNVPNFVDLETGGYGETIQDALNSTQTPTMANFATLANVLAGCITRVTPDASGRFLRGGHIPDRRGADGHFDGGRVHRPLSVAPAGASLRVAERILSHAEGEEPAADAVHALFELGPSAWVFPLKFTGGGLSAAGKMMIDSEGNVWAGDNFIVGAQNQDALWDGNLSKFAPNGKPLSPVITGFTGGGVEGIGFGLAIDAQDNCWGTSYGSKTIVEFDKTGKPLSPPGGWNFGGKLGKMQGIIAAPNGDIWALDVEMSRSFICPRAIPTRRNSSL